MKLVTLLVALAVMAGCATNSGVVRAGEDTFKIHQRGAGFVGSEKIKDDVMLQAGRYCADQGKTVQVVNVMMAAPPYIGGHFPRAEVQFRCVDPTGSPLSRPAAR